MRPRIELAEPEHPESWQLQVKVCLPASQAKTAQPSHLTQRPDVQTGLDPPWVKLKLGELCEGGERSQHCVAVKGQTKLLELWQLQASLPPLQREFEVSERLQVGQREQEALRRLRVACAAWAAS